MPFVVEILILVTLACYRVRVIHQVSCSRIGASGVSQETLKIIVNSIWAMGCGYSAVLMFGIRGNYAKYQPLRYRCAPANFSDPRYKIVNNVLTFCVIILPMLVIVTTNLYILLKVTKFRIKREIAASDPPTFRGLLQSYLSRKHKTRTVTSPASGNTALTITLICGVFVASYTPLIIFIALMSQRAVIPQWFQIFFTHSLSLNITLNPFIYALTNKRFRLFVAERLRVDTIGDYEV